MTKTEDNYFCKVFSECDAVLAPMAGVTDAAFRSICAEYGAKLMYTEMVSAKGMCYNNANTHFLLQIAPNETETGVQIFGSDEHFLSEAVKRFLNESDFKFIDINMGCPVKKVTSNGEGSALLADTKKLYSVAKAVKDASSKPVSAKIRTGTGGKISCIDNAKALEDAGMYMIAIHGRTKEMMYSGKADYELIARTVECVDIPVIANGDVFCAEDYFKIKRETKAAAVMVARGAMGNPFIFREILSAQGGRTYAPPSEKERLDIALEHLSLLVKYKGEKIACREFRKQLCWYTKGMTGGAKIRRHVAELETVSGIEEFIKSSFEN